MRRFICFMAAMMAFFAISSAAASDAEIPVPDGYVLQVLDPFDGRIARPKDWHYLSGGTPSGWLWILSEQDPSGFYETGMRIQMLLGPDAAGVGKINVLNQFVEQKRASTKILSECPAAANSDFTGKCLEVLEDIQNPKTGDTNRYHIRYAIMAHRTMDMVTVTTFGAPEAEWARVAPMAEVMSRVMLIGKDFRPPE